MAGDFNISAGLELNGEKEFSDAVKNINREMSVLGSEMKKVTAQFADNSGSMEALTAKHDVLSRKADEQKNKIQTLTAALENAKQEYGENSSQVQNWQIKLNNAEADLARTESQVRQTADQMQNFGRETNEAANKIDDAGQKTLSFGDILKANILGNAIVDGIKAIGGAFANFASDALGAADSLQQQADVTGLSAERLQELQYAGNNLGVGLDTLTGAQSKLTKSMLGAKDGTGAQADAFKALGISVLDSNGNMRDAKQVMTEALSALNGVGNETERNQIAMQLFGKSAMDLNPIIAAGGDELNRLAEEARNSGAVMSNETVAGLDTFGDTMDNLKSSAQGVIGTMLGELAPSFTPLIEKIKGIDTKPLTDGLKFIIDNAGNIAAGLAGITAGLVAFKAVGAITALVDSFKTFKLAQEGATVAQWALNAAQSANPIGIIVIAVAGLVAALTVLWNTNEGFRTAVTGAWNDLSNTCKNVFGTISDFFTVKIPAAFNVVINFVKNNWKELTAFLVNPIGGAIALLYNINPKFKQWVDGLLGGFKNWLSGMAGIGGHLVEGLWNGISDKAGWLWNKVSGFFSSLTDRIKDFFGIHSPSRLFRDEIGVYLAQGVGVGFEQEMNSVAKQINNSIPVPEIQANAQIKASERIGETFVNGMAALMGANQGQGGAYTINVMLPDGTKLASAVFDPLRDISRQRGVTLA